MSEKETEIAKIVAYPREEGKGYGRWEIYPPHNIFSVTESEEVVQTWIDDLKEAGFFYEVTEIRPNGQEESIWRRAVPHLDAEVAREAAKYLTYRRLKRAQEGMLEVRALKEAGEERQSYLRFLAEENHRRTEELWNASRLLRDEAERGEIKQTEVFSSQWPWYKKVQQWVAVWFINDEPGQARLFDTRDEAKEFLSGLVSNFHNNNHRKGTRLVTNISRREIEIRE
jgi:hypothetical protein